MFNDEQFDRLTQEVNMNVDEKRIGSLLRFLFQSRWNKQTQIIGKKYSTKAWSVAET